MFAAGYFPGVLMAVSLMIVVAIVSKKRNYRPSRQTRATFREIMAQFFDSIWALSLPFGIILGLRFGIFTPTEAGAMTVLASILLGIFVYRELKWEHLVPIIKDTIYGTGSVMLIIIGASVFGYYLNWERIPQMMTQSLLNFTTNPYAMLFLINVLLLIMGMFLEGGAALIITAPLLVPVILKLGIDPIHFGMVIIVNIMIGGITPPFGSMMFTTCSITKVSIQDFLAESWGFLVALLICLGIITYMPWLVLILPNLIG
jgi:tripartite ATP-independent transporter DctM subunit